MKEYLKAQSKTNDVVINQNFKSDELDRFSRSDYRWAANRTKPYIHQRAKKGEIYQFEFGKNFQPEMSYEHRGLVIGVKQKLLYVLPIFSYNPNTHTDVYHPVDFPESISDLFLLKNSDFSFINHDSVLKLNDIRTVSINRILYKQSGVISPASDTYKKIEELVLHKYFPGFIYEYSQLEEKLSNAQLTLKEQDKSLQSLSIENDNLKKQIEELSKKHEKSANQ